jgi:hypothetical protein
MATTSDLNQIIVPLQELRMLIVDLMKDGIYEAPLGDFLLMLKEVTYRADEEATPGWPPQDT